MDKGASIKNIGTSLAGKAVGLPGVSFAMNALGKMDNFKNLNELDRNFILDQAGGNRPSKDPFGINRRSAFGNYGAYVDKLYEKDKDKEYDPKTQKFLYDRKVYNDKLAIERQIKKQAADEAAAKAAVAAAAAKAQQTRDYGNYGESGGSYSGRGDEGATGANFSGDFATDSASYDLKNGGLATMFRQKR
jgi:hypothetical protein